MEKEVEKIQKLKLSEIKDFLTTKSLKELYDLKEYLDDVYYNSGDSILSDSKYDILKDFLKDARVGAKLRTNENRVKLPYWLGSADKLTPENPGELKRWIEKNKVDTYIITDKLDGVSCLYGCIKGVIKLYTRGDGVEGADISYLSSILKLPKTKKDIFIRGELIISKENFKNSTDYKNPRNMVSGLVGGKTARKGLDMISFVAYEIVGDGVMEKQSEQILKLKNLGFETVHTEFLSKLTFKNLEQILKKRKLDSLYEIDGLIVQPDFIYDRNTEGNPSYMFAFKILEESNIHETKVLKVEWNVSKWGQLKPVVIVEPVLLNDITINRVTAHNAKYIQENNIGKDSIIQITRSNDVIPYIVKVVKGTTPDLPDGNLLWDKNHVNILANSQDDSMCIKLVSDMFSHLNIKFVSNATVKKMFENGLDDFVKIISADKKKLLEIFKEKTAQRIYTNIRKGLENIKLSTFIGASGILGYGIGKKKIDSLLLSVPDFFTVKRTSKNLKNLILQVEGFSEITAEKIIVNFNNCLKLLKKVSPFISFIQEERVNNDFVDKIFVMTGFRDKDLEEEIAKRGGKVSSSVSKKTFMLVTKNNEESTKLKKAQELGITIYTKDEFISFLEKKG
jgi:DNA ligase (NAD+)